MLLIVQLIKSVHRKYFHVKLGYNVTNGKDEVKTEIIDHVIKKEIKTELEEVTKKSHGFICPTCNYFSTTEN